MSTLRTTVAALALAAGGNLALAESPKPRFEHQEIDKIQIGYGLAIGDVDGDKKVDILLADAKQIVWYANPGRAGEAWKKHVIAEKVTPADNVCIAARDIDGDGKVEIAIGAMWNPGETNDPAKSGAVYYLMRPADPTQKWEPVKLHHEVTTHRMKWVKTGKDRFVLVVVPLHGKGNNPGTGEGDGVKVLAYQPPANPKEEWKTTLIDGTMHKTHNFDVLAGDPAGAEVVILGGKEGLKAAITGGDTWETKAAPFSKLSEGVGEVRLGLIEKGQAVVAAIEPMHGSKLVVYVPKEQDDDDVNRLVLDDTLKEGHALACADVLGIGRPQVVVGWRMPNKNVKVGIKMFIPSDATCTKWEQHLIDDNQMACEDLAVADLDGDGKPEIIAAGRATKNVKIYWNKTGQ
jgi:hypothetical protein